MPMNVDNVNKACCILHNYLEDKDTATIYSRFNPDQEPYLQDDGAILDLNGYRSAAAV